MEPEPPARERAPHGAGAEGAAAALLQRAQEVADQLRQEAVEDAERRDGATLDASTTRPQR